MEGVDGMGGRVGWEVTKSPHQDTLGAFSCMRNGPCYINRPQRYPVSSGNNFRSPPPNQHPPIMLLLQSLLRRVSKMPSKKANYLTFNTGYTGDGQPLSVSVGWGSKIKFSCGANMESFSQAGHFHKNSYYDTQMSACSYRAT